MWRQQDQKFKAILIHIVYLRAVWGIQDPAEKKEETFLETRSCYIILSGLQLRALLSQPP